MKSIFPVETPLIPVGDEAKPSSTQKRCCVSLGELYCALNMVIFIVLVFLLICMRLAVIQIDKTENHECKFEKTFTHRRKQTHQRIKQTHQSEKSGEME